MRMAAIAMELQQHTTAATTTTNHAFYNPNSNHKWQPSKSIKKLSVQNIFVPNEIIQRERERGSKIEKERN